MQPSNRPNPEGGFGRADLGMRQPRAIPGGGTGANSAYQFRQPDGGYEAGAEAQEQGSGTSIFDPVLCELIYRWFVPPGGLVLDPFAGGSVRGIVASMLGRGYVGVELRAEQIAANRTQADRICAGQPQQPVWHEGDARDVLPTLDVEADGILACPPYGDLECYPTDPRDLSTMTLADFRAAYWQIIRDVCAKLKEDRFAIFVVGDYRDADGLLVGFPADTIKAFEACGLRLYNEAVLLTAIGSLPVRCARIFEAGRKLGKTHQNVLVFIKGDPVAATQAIGPVECGDVPTLDGSEGEGESDERTDSGDAAGSAE
jgi:hypothetical protein